MNATVTTNAVEAGGPESQARSDVAFLLLDGLRRSQPAERSEVVLCALGLTREGTGHPLALRRVPTEEEPAWRALLQDLRADGIGADLLLVCSDGHPALVKAIHAVFPDIPQQISVAHRLLALARKVEARWRAECLGEARRIFAAPDRAAAVALFREWQSRWLKQGELAVRSLEADLASCLTFYRFPAHLWSKIRTVNLVERTFRAARRETAAMSPQSLANGEAVQRPPEEPGPGAEGNGAAAESNAAADGLAGRPEMPTSALGSFEIPDTSAPAIAPDQDLSAITAPLAPEPESPADFAARVPAPLEVVMPVPPALRLVALEGDEGFTEWLRAYHRRELRTKVVLMITSLAGLVTGLALSLAR